MHFLLVFFSRAVTPTVIADCVCVCRLYSILCKLTLNCLFFFSKAMLQERDEVIRAVLETYKQYQEEEKDDASKFLFFGDSDEVDSGPDVVDKGPDDVHDGKQVYLFKMLIRYQWRRLD